MIVYEKKREVSEVARALFGDSIIRQLEADSDIRQQSIAIAKKAKLVIEELRRFNHRYKGKGFALSQLVGQEYNAMKDELLRANLEFNQDFFMLKEQAMTYCQRQMNLYDKISELLGVQEQIMRKPDVAGRNRVLKQLRRQETELLKIIKEESEALTPSKQLKAASDQAEGLKSLTSFVADLEKMSTLLRTFGQFSSDSTRSSTQQPIPESTASLNALLSAIFPYASDNDSDSESKIDFEHH